MNEITRKSKLMSKIYYFCDRCDRRGEYIDLDFINIAPASQRKQTCPADVDPSNELFCPYHDNYQALLDELHEMEAAEDAGEALKSKEEAKMKKITVEYKGIGDKEAQTITRESYSFRPAYDDYDSTFECEYQQSLGKLIRALYAEYDIIHETEKKQAEYAIPYDMNDDPEDDYTGLFEMCEYEKQREAWIDAKLSDSAFVMERFNEMFAAPGKYGEYIKIIAIEN